MIEQFGFWIMLIAAVVAIIDALIRAAGKINRRD
jgi:hypothetical protein